jgi:hypothetical protein
MPTIGYLSTRSLSEAKYVTDVFTQGLNENGYVEGRNLAIEISLGGPSTLSARSTICRNAGRTAIVRSFSTSFPLLTDKTIGAGRTSK